MAILVVAGSVGSRYRGLAPGLLAAKAGVCIALWLTALAFIPAADRVRLRDAFIGVVRRRTLRAPLPDDSVAAASPPRR
jgi:hypothetical protein